MVITTNIAAALVASTLLSVALLVACGGDKSGPSLSNQPVDTREAPETRDTANVAPEVDVSAELTQAAIVRLSGSAIDETLPGGDLITEWTQTSGPATVTFADPSKLDTTATFPTSGTYVLRLTASDGEYTISDEITVVVQSQATLP